VEIARAFKDAGADLIDVLLRPGQQEAAKPVYGRMYQTPFADRIRNEVGIATIAVGAISEADHVNSIIAAGRADLCAIARPHLANPAWTLHEAAKLQSRDVDWPKQYQFTTTLPRFDLMSQLERSPDGLKMNELSRRMMVTGGNVTGITDQLVTEGLVERINVEGDRRAWRVRLTARGRKLFNEMAQQHEDWIVEAFAGLNSKEIAQLHKLLGKVKQHSHSQLLAEAE
jgi:DNA-binding MarR family transcriptional regulator